MVPILLLTALFLPFLLYPVEVILPYPHIVEELAKASLVFLIIKDIGSDEKKQIIKYALLVGVFFALTEAVFYIFNIVKVGNFNTFLIRLLITIPFHSFTCILIALPTLKKRVFIVFGVIAAMVVHYLYNLIMARLLF